jgi:glycosyltransferase involved in cell wall biosynthesis
MKPRSVLLVAYQCGPSMGSVSQIGWEWYVRLRAEYQVSLVTHVRNRVALEEAGVDDTVRYIDTEWFAAPLYQIAKWLFPKSEHSVFLVSSLDYFLFDLVCYLTLKRELKAGSVWHLIHRVTPVTLAAPTWLGRLGIPLIVGPLNCGLGSPKGFDSILRQESTWLIHLRKLGRWFDSLIGSSHRTARILTATNTTLEAVAPGDRKRCRMMLENGVNLEHFSASPWPPEPSQQQALRVLFVGRLIPLKGLDMLLEAVAAMHYQGMNVKLEVIGTGPMELEWKNLSLQLGIQDCVVFSGSQPSYEVALRMAASHVLCLPSVRESGGAVLLEAMSCARPVIALAYGGPTEIVNDEVGALLAMASPKQVIAGLSICLTDIIAFPAAWRQRGIAARRLTERKYSWPAKIALAGAHYSELISEKAHHV